MLIHSPCSCREMKNVILKVRRSCFSRIHASVPRMSSGELVNFDVGAFRLWIGYIVVIVPILKKSMASFLTNVVL